MLYGGRNIRRNVCKKFIRQQCREKTNMYGGAGIFGTTSSVLNKSEIIKLVLFSV
jgi:hypothetical protein